MPKRISIAVDLDGTLAQYDRWPADGSVGAPVLRMVQIVKAALAAGVDVWIFTARVAVENDQPEHIRDVEEQHARIAAWCEEHIGRALPITAIKLRRFDEIWDDKAIAIVKNEGVSFHDRALAEFGEAGDAGDVKRSHWYEHFTRSQRVTVHADGGDCHGRTLVGGICPGCGIAPDMQSTARWPAYEAR